MVSKGTLIRVKHMFDTRLFIIFVVKLNAIRGSTF